MKPTWKAFRAKNDWYFSLNIASHWVATQVFL